MGFMRSRDTAKLEDSVVIPVHDLERRLLGFYFPATGVVRTPSGETWRVDADHLVHAPGRPNRRLDVTHNVLLPLTDQDS